MELDKNKRVSRFIDDARITAIRHSYRPSDYQYHRRMTRLELEGKKTPVIKAFRSDSQKQLDRLSAAQGKMSREEFHKKWNTFSETSSFVSESTEYTNINGKEYGSSRRITSHKLPGHPRVTRVRGSVLVPTQKEFGLGKFFKKSFFQTFRPKHILRRVGWGILGAAAAGPIGFHVGRFLANQKAWGQETDRYGHSFLGPQQPSPVEQQEQREFSGPREIVSRRVAEKGKKEGVIQKKPNGKWGIISYKTTLPTWWPADYSTREKAEAALRGYQANK